MRSTSRCVASVDCSARTENPRNQVVGLIEIDEAGGGLQIGEGDKSQLHSHADRLAAISYSEFAENVAQMSFYRWNLEARLDSQLLACVAASGPTQDLQLPRSELHACRGQRPRLLRRPSEHIRNHLPRYWTLTSQGRH